MSDLKPYTSPWVYAVGDYQGNTISATVVFNTVSPYSLTSVTMNRQPGCVYANIYFGVGSDGSPNSTITQFSVPTGTTVAKASVLQQFGFTTFTNVLAGQITAGP